MAKHNYIEIGREVIARTRDLEEPDWSDGDKVRMIALLIHRFMEQPLEGYEAFIEWSKEGSANVEDDLLDIANRLDVM